MYIALHSKATRPPQWSGCITTNQDMTRLFHSSPRAMSTIHAQVASRHEAASIAQQEHRSPTVLIGVAQSPQHVVLRPFNLPLRVRLKERLDHGGNDVAG